MGTTTRDRKGARVRARKYLAERHPELALTGRVGTVQADHNQPWTPVLVRWDGLNQVREHPASGLRDDREAR